MTPTREPWFSGKLKVHEQLKSLQYKYIMQKMSSISEEDPWIQPQLRPSVLGQYSTSIKVKPKPLKSSFFLVNSVSTITAPSWSFLCAINWFTNRLHVLFIYLFIYFFLSGFSFTDTEDLQDSWGREWTIFFSFYHFYHTRSRTFRHLFATLHVRMTITYF